MQDFVTPFYEHQKLQAEATMSEVKNLPAIYVPPKTVIAQSVMQRIRASQGAEPDQWMNSAKTIVYLGMASVGCAVVIMFVPLPQAFSDWWLGENNENLFGLAAFYGVFGYLLWVGGLRWVKSIKQKVQNQPYEPVHFECPACMYRFDINKEWTCGNCKDEGHDTRRMNTPIHGCDAKHCPDRGQAAIQCPECHRHLIIDPKRYLEQKTAEPPHSGAARMVDDKATPVTGSEAPGSGKVDLNSLFDDL